MKTTLYLIRQASAVAPHDRHDAPLSRLGLRQAEMTRDFLAVRAVDHCYCGPRRRARQTAGIIADPHGLVPQVVDALDEANLDAGLFRVTDALDQLLRRHDGEALLVVAHHEVHRAYLADVLRLSPEQAARVPLDSCGISVVVRDGVMTTVTTLNASFHLQGLAA